MKLSVLEYLKILYGDFDRLDDKDKIKYLKDKEFLEKYIDDVNIDYYKHKDMIDDYFKQIPDKYPNPDREYARLVIDRKKEWHDKETIIVKYVEDLLCALESDSFINHEFNTSFMDLIYFNRREQESNRGVSKCKRSISLNQVIDLTEGFIRDVLGSSEMLEDFRMLLKKNRLIVNDPNHQYGSEYYFGNIYFSFDGTIDSANTLIHEFMHYWIEKISDPSMDRETHTMFNEFLSIYYEIVFIKYMENRGLLNDGEPQQLLASRLKTEYSKDPNNILIILLELCQELKRRKELDTDATIDKEDIIDILGKHFPSEISRDNLWKKADIIEKYCKDNIFIIETVSGPVMYRLNHALAKNTCLDFDTAKQMLKLVPYIINRDHDDDLIKKYREIISQNKFKVNNQQQSESPLPTQSRLERVLEIYKTIIGKDGFYI